ncbi:MAG: hypothetical protein ACUVX8_05715 [Candidatus Zipacnadales bacterium]
MPRRYLALSVALWVGAIGLAQNASVGLRVTNLKSGERLRYPVALLIGDVDAEDGSTLIVRCDAEDGRTIETHTTTFGKRFKALVELAPGKNRLALSCKELSQNLEVSYRPQTNRYYVRFIYYTDSSGNTEYQSEIEGDPQDYAAKIDTVAKLMQTFTAETLHNHGYGRRTFRIELDENGKVPVHVVRGEHPVEYYHAREGGVLYSEIWKHLNRDMPDPFAKNVVLMAFTRFDAAQKKPLAHTALGGGNQGLFGSAGMFVWPSSVADIQRAFTDERRVDSTRTHDDSAGRSTYRALAATTIGATLHEMSHCFGLPHSPDPFCIMSRGFDHIGRMFTLVEPPHAHRAEPYVFPEQEIARFAEVGAGRLAYQRYFALDAREYEDGPAAEYEIDRHAGTLTLTSARGSRVVGINGNDQSRYDDVFRGPAPRRLEYAIDELNQRGGGRAVDLVVIDTHGNETHVPASALVDPGDFVRAWQISTEAVEWPSRNAFVGMTSEQLSVLTEKLSNAELKVSNEAFIDLTHSFPEANEERVTYAFRKVLADGERKAKLWTGSDDALRVWLNGELVVEKLELRPAAPDQEPTSITLHQGINEFVVEVSNGEGGWGFYFRLEDEKGVPLVLDDEGYLRSKGSGVWQ